MPNVHQIKSWLRRLAHHGKSGAELDDEISEVFNSMVERRVSQGMTREEAMRATRLDCAAADDVKEEVPDVRIAATLEAILRDLRYAARALRKQPGFTTVAILTLAAGIGANSAIFSVVNAVLISPLPYPHPDALVGVWHSIVRQGIKGNNVGMSSPMYFGYREQNRTFEKFGVWSSGTASVSGAGDPEQVRTLSVTEGVLPALGIPPAFGRWFSRDDDTAGTPETVILTTDTGSATSGETGRCSGAA